MRVHVRKGRQGRERDVRLTQDANYNAYTQGGGGGLVKDSFAHAIIPGSGVLTIDLQN